MNYQLPSLIGETTDPGLVLADPEEGIRKNFRLALWIIAAFVAGLVGLSALTSTQGAVIGAGEVTVESRIKKIAHPQGGVIAAVEVREGQRVRRGQVLMRLDTTVSGASALASGDTVEQLLANIAVLQAERDGLAVPQFPAELTVNPTPAKQAAMDNARRLLALRRGAQGQEMAQIEERIRQTQAQIVAYGAQKNATDKQSALVRSELDGLRTLRDQQLVTVNRLNQIERTAVDLEGTAASFHAQMAQARARIAELRQSKMQILQDSRSKAGQELVELQARLNDQKVRSATATDMFNRSLVRAPDDGVVDKMAFTTVGGIVPPMETIMEIVPSNDRLTITASVSPYDIDQLSLNQPASLRFSAFNNRITPELFGRVTYISAERITNEKTGQVFYKATVEVSAQELRKLGNLKLKPGMPVEVFFRTGERSLISYITKPLRDQFARAFREE
ncbi:HlyD family type I secretion periplasmic adaptor subunit [Novosphingobium sp.]|uniref:HlyD family type I secretion periplasmic adaptor subunit n=1 Tax=Novosphingobium sp. TaxID=1874826 RepID=UPI002636F587|nr:HlyD family type I secretion periplasmic adaptor subunit [Novosphingobium sp.]